MYCKVLVVEACIIQFNGNTFRLLQIFNIRRCPYLCPYLAVIY